MIIALQALLYFRETLVTVIERLLRPYYRKLTFKFKSDENSDDEESDEHVFAEYHDEKGVVFFPPVYAQRYAAVSDCLMDERWIGKLEKVVDFGYHDMSFIKYLKDVPGIKHILGVDIETIPLRCSSDLLRCDNYLTKREKPLQVTLFQGNAADPDYRLIGCDAVVAIEMIEHMLPHDLERLIHTVFGFVKPWVVIFTTPNGDFNVLFKALEKNGLRRLDHMFEWSREQFHDWCSNIVSRYPDYTVTCKGVGPGPSDTLHLGCCSQLGLFVAKNYTKQPDLDLNSLALVAKRSSPNDLNHIIGSWESTESTQDNILCALPSVESYPELLYDESSCVTIVTATTLLSLESMEYKDKLLQCNLDSDIGKNFLMFDDEMYSKVLVPRREKYCRVYEIEDVASRLNCSTLQVKKFSKPTQSLMAKNKMESLAHTREVVNEIRHLTKMLNFDKDSTDQVFEGNWSNINWGTNAPYWNQYYRIVREYKYPFEVKTEETRILDLITEEIHKLIDIQSDEEISPDSHKLEIPINQLMRVVEHITTDVEKVKELLEWNGYEVVDGLVIHSRLIVDNISEISHNDGWQDDNTSDWDSTDIRSSTYSNGSTIVPDYYGLRLRHAIDQKLSKLRTLLTAEKDITTELDRVVCRLMKLSLCTSKGRKNPPPISWMQCKLFDLLVLTEKSIERRTRLRYPFKAIEYHTDLISIDEMKLDAVGNVTISKYENLQPVPVDLLDYEDNNILEPTNDVIIAKEQNDIRNKALEGKDQLHKCDFQLVPYSSYTDNFIKSEDSACSISNVTQKEQKKVNDKSEVLLHKKYKIKEATRAQNQAFFKQRGEGFFESKNNAHKYNKTKTNKKASSRKSSYINLLKNITLKEVNKSEEYKMFQSTITRPIPGSLIKLCDSQTNKNIEKENSSISSNNMPELFELNIAATEECMFIGILTEDGEETIAMQRNIGTSPEIDLDISENGELLESTITLSQDNSFYSKLDDDTEDIQTQSIFLYDLNEPSTSKGFHHQSIDVQCGPDITMLSQTTSFINLTKRFSKGIKIEEPTPDINNYNNIYDFGTIPKICDSTLTVNMGIKIKESIQDLQYQICDVSETQVNDDIILPLSSFEGTEIIHLKPTSNSLNIENASSEVVVVDVNVENSIKSPTQITTSSKNTSDFQIQVERNEKKVLQIPHANYDKLNLICGGFYVHSFKGRHDTEDVVYHGAWKRNQQPPTRNRNTVVRKSLLYPKKTVLVSKPKSTNKTEENKSLQSKKVFSQYPVNTSKKVTRKVLRSSQLSNNIKAIYSTKKPTNFNATETAIKKDKFYKKYENLNNYLPLYLRKIILRSILKENKSRNDCEEQLIKKTEKMLSPLNTRHIIKDLIKVPEKTVVNNITYTIFRNEIQVEKESNVQSHIATGMIKNDNLNRSYSPQSQHSSNCSSPNSVATVRAISPQSRLTCNRRNSTSSERSSLNVIESENIEQKCKGLSRRGKSIKNSPVISNYLCDNKENDPESSKHIKYPKNNKRKVATSVFLRRTKGFFMNQLTPKTSTLVPLASTHISKRERTKSLTKPLQLTNITTVEPLSSSMSDASLVVESKNNDGDTTTTTTNITNNNVFMYENFIEPSENNSSNKDESSNSESIHNTKSSIMSAIRKLIENKLNFPENSYDRNDSDSETVILGKDDNDITNSNNNLASSMENVHEISCISEMLVDYSHIHCPNKENYYETSTVSDTVSKAAYIKSLDQESDGVSLKSFSSMSTSKLSEYYLADNEFETPLPENDNIRVNITSIQDIFERKKLNIMPNISGVLATQAFSGFSVNEPISGDQPDYINFVDSETGSFTYESRRQTASEEIFVSGRSSDTYESCYVDDDAYVPNWLFNMISQHQSTEESEAEDTALPMIDPGLDMNGNIEDAAVGVGAGAGDGRGMHSDHSHDSSGRGTSLSSSETSTESQNEAVFSVVIGPSNLTAQADYFREPTSEMIGASSRPNTVSNTIENNGEGILNHRNRVARNLINPVPIVSDIDADVSSLDTDVVDSD